MLSTLKDAWRIPEIRKKILFTLGMLLVFRIGSAVPVPFMNKEMIQSVFEANQGGLLQFLDLMAGGTFSQFSIFATNIYPYITASIIIQLLTVAIPALEELSKEGEEGKKKIAKYTRYGAIGIAAIQASGYTFGLFRSAIETTSTLDNVLVILSMVAGTALLIWIGELITEKGVGNGISLLIFIGIISRLPAEFFSMYRNVDAGVVSAISVIILLAVVLVTVAVVVALQEGQRKIPVQYAKRVVGRKMYGGQSTHIPIQVLMAGVMPVIFANALMSLPQTVTLFSDGAFANWVQRYMTPAGSGIGVWVYTILNIIMIMFFTYFYTAIQFNTVEYSKNLQQNGGFIPGIRPGRPTSEFLTKVVNRIVFVGGFALAVLSTLPVVLSRIFGMQVSFGGTAVIIAVGVVLETVRQIESQMLMRHYKGFLK